MVNVLNLFEYKNKEKLDEDFEPLESYLEAIWSKRERNIYFTEDTDLAPQNQKLLSFLHKTREIQARKFVGVIKFEGKIINLLPKIFYQDSKQYSETEINNINCHILWWLSYCQKIKFPNYQTGLGNIKNDFFEVIVYLFASYSRKILSISFYQEYINVTSETRFIKGQLDLTSYVGQNLSKGNWNRFNCIYDSFEIDNPFNRLIKYVASILVTFTSSRENKVILNEILFILDEVGHEQFSAIDCQKFQFNPIYQDFITIRDYCELFLSNSISYNYKNELRLFAFLLPMEYVFEDFVSGFIKKELPTLKVTSQRSDTKLDKGELFTLRPDLYIALKDKSIIADTKYKFLSNDPGLKYIISQGDLYQMISYAIRFKINEVKLLYPKNETNKSDPINEEILVVNEQSDGQVIQINIHELSIYDLTLISHDNDMSLDEMFVGLKLKLQEELSKILA